jgi:hypothetical protein
VAAEKKTKPAHKKKSKSRKSPKTVKRTFDARPDTMDFRDRMFVPTLIEVPPTRPLSEYLKSSPPVQPSVATSVTTPMCGTRAAAAREARVGLSRRVQKGNARGSVKEA